MTIRRINEITRALREISKLDLSKVSQGFYESCIADAVMILEALEIQAPLKCNQKSQSQE